MRFVRLFFEQFRLLYGRTSMGVQNGDMGASKAWLVRLCSINVIEQIADVMP
jgi:hypothetical protein